MATNSVIPYFGRSWSLVVTPHRGPMANVPITVSTDQFGPRALRVEFQITQVAWKAFWQAEFVIYNADGIIPGQKVSLYDAVIQEGDEVSFCAGYQADVPQNSVAPIIWDGFVFYTVQDRVDVVDKRLILHCLNSKTISNADFIAENVPAMSTQYSQARFIADHAMIPMQIDQQMWEQATANVINPLGADQLPRGKTYFGNATNYLTAIANQNNLLSWHKKTFWNMASLQDPAGPIVGVYAPLQILDGPPRRDGKISYSLIGQPEHTSLGINFRILLDPVVQVTAPFAKVVVQKQYVRQATINYPNEFPPRPLNFQDNYVVVGVKFVGDTRGNPWYSDVTGVANVIDAVQMLGMGKDADASHPS